MNRKKKKYTVLVLAAVLCCGALLLSPGDKVPQVRVMKAAFSPIVETIPSSGKIRPVVEVTISPDVSGEIVDINFKEGDFVRKGDVILQIKRDLYLSVVEQAEAALGTLEAQFHRQEAELRQAERSYRRNLVLFEGGAISVEDFEACEAAYIIAKESLSAAEFNVKSGEAALKEANENLVKTTIISPIDGTISALDVEEGERVVGTSQMAGTQMLRIADLSRMEVVVDVSENDVVHISAGDSVRIDVDAWPKLKFDGIVTQIANSAKNVGLLFDQVTNFEVRIEILPQQARLLPGMSASTQIVTRSSDAAISVPVSAVFARERKEFVWVLKEDMTVEERQVETGLQDLKNIEITSGLLVGESIVTSPASAISKDLANGMKVRLTQEN